MRKIFVGKECPVQNIRGMFSETLYQVIIDLLTVDCGHFHVDVFVYLLSISGNSSKTSSEHNVTVYNIN